MNIIVNGQSVECEDEYLTYVSAIMLAMDVVSLDADVVCTVVVSKPARVEGIGSRRIGFSLVRNQSTPVVEGMILNVAVTGAA